MITQTIIQHYFHSDHMIPHVNMTVPHKQDQEHRPRHSHTTYCIQMWVIHLLVEIKNCLPSMLTYRLLYWYTYYSPLLQWYSDSSTDRSSFPATHIITTISPGQTQVTDTKINHFEASHCSGHYDLNEVIRFQITVTSHSQVTVTLT